MNNALALCEHGCNGAMGVPITYMDKHNPDEFEIIKFRKGNDDKDLTYTIRSNTILTDRQTDRQTQNYALPPDCHPSESVTASWVCQSHSLTNSTTSNSALSEQPKVKERASQTGCGIQTVELLSRS